jgi:hypothetical protein
MRKIADFLSSLIIVFWYFIRLIFYPYKTMRKILKEKDIVQVFFIFFLVFLYLKFAYFLKDSPYPASFLFLIFLVGFFVTVSFFYLSSRFFEKDVKFISFLFGFSYSLLPTLIWFGTNSLLFLFLPPPRTNSILGQGFSIFYLAFSISLLAWKLILVYLTIRFSTGFSFWRIVYLFLLYLLIFIPYTLLLNLLKLFRVPLI